MSEHTHSHDGPPIVSSTNIFTEEFWEERYATATHIWSGAPNQTLVDYVGSEPLGTAIDIGCGEGADAVWLAQQGWHATGVDVSKTALERAQQHGLAAGSDIAQRLRWEYADILHWQPTDMWDLVTAHFVHLPGQYRNDFHQKCAAATRPGGLLLLVAHHPSDLETSIRRPQVPDVFFTPQEAAQVLDPQDWDIIVADAPSRTVTDDAGKAITIRDTVLKARRRK